MAGGLKSVRNRRDDALNRIGWDRLESLLADHYRHEGYTVEHVGTGGTGRRFGEKRGQVHFPISRPGLAGRCAGRTPANRCVLAWTMAWKSSRP